ncbi:hypothetical protein NDU88_009077 [Pleurodeles waltl]|uniref:Uncharacterized protein n=1 Tax=Pleurodeles waltl TaxID=8319 RepID=A0AAV7QSJ9_PLEWA|nr:hypothetical protein NDU88_009077 [Pleurodeles waltl]
MERQSAHAQCVLSAPARLLQSCEAEGKLGYRGKEERAFSGSVGAGRREQDTHAQTISLAPRPPSHAAAAAPAPVSTEEEFWCLRGSLKGWEVLTAMEGLGRLTGVITIFHAAELSKTCLMSVVALAEDDGTATLQ